MLEIKNLSKSFGQLNAIDELSISIKKGEITIISGADGAGKSTIFKLILGLEKKDSGSIFLYNEDIGTDYSKITSICGYMPERFSLYQDLSVDENLNFFSDIRQVPKKRKDALKKRLLESMGMAEFKQRRAGALSGGMKQKLALATILLSSPEIIILDEPTTGVDPLSRIEFFNIINTLKDEGKTIIISTPYLDEAENGDSIIFLKNGKTLKAGSIEQLKNNIPFKLFSILPDGNIFDIVLDLKKRDNYRDRVYIKGKHIKVIGNENSNSNELSFIPNKKIIEENPGLEDIYLYYEKLYLKNGEVI